MESKASAVWRGSLKEGSGVFSTGSGLVSDAPYTFKTRFEGEKGTNPEELIGAAHAACFSMAFSAELGGANITPESISTSATVTLGKTEAGFGITSVHLDSKARVPGGDKEAIERASLAAKSGCPVSKLLNTKITLDLEIEV
jgi:lipoyl-dependent peroxiredoxin